MHRKEFEQDRLGISSITLNDLKQAEREEGQKEPISNPCVRALRKHVVAVNSQVVGSDNA